MLLSRRTGVHEREATNLLSEYLSKLTFTDAKGLVLPEEDLPEGYLFNPYALFPSNSLHPSAGIVDDCFQRKTWISDANEEETRESVRKCFYSSKIKGALYCFSKTFSSLRWPNGDTWTMTTALARRH